MAFHTSIRRRRVRKRINKDFELQLTSMMDVLVIIVVFLLKSYETSSNSLVSVKGIQIPTSISEVNPMDSLQVIVTPEAMTFESERIVEFVQSLDSVGAVGPGSEAKYQFKLSDLDEGGQKIIPLYDALLKSKDKAELLRAKSSARTADGQPLPFDGILAIQADKRVRYDTIRRIMYTAAAAGYRTFRFLALRKPT